jgi:stage V sporulation protein SpoVS
MTKLELEAKIADCIKAIGVARDFLANDEDNADMVLDRAVAKQAELIERYSHMLHN